MSALDLAVVVVAASAIGVAIPLVMDRLVQWIGRRNAVPIPSDVLLTVYDRGVVRRLDASEITAERIDVSVIRRG